MWRFRKFAQSFNWLQITNDSQHTVKFMTNEVVNFCVQNEYRMYNNEKPLKKSNWKKYESIHFEIELICYRRFIFFSILQIQKHLATKSFHFFFGCWWVFHFHPEWLLSSFFLPIFFFYHLLQLRWNCLNMRKIGREFKKSEMKKMENKHAKRYERQIKIK